MPAIIIERSRKSITNDADSAADIEHITQSPIEQLNSDEVRPSRVSVDVSAVHDQPCRLRRSQLSHTPSQHPVIFNNASDCRTNGRTDYGKG